jgi:predicted transposase YbfD/YdcC
MYICIYTKPEMLEDLNEFFHWGISEDYEKSAKKIRGNWSINRVDQNQVEVYISYDQYMMLFDNE